MYLKYTVQSGTAAQIQNEIGDLLMGDITDVSTCVYGSAFIDGTRPTAGTYTRTTDATTSHLKLIKKHCQWNAVTLPATMELQLFNDDGTRATLKVSDMNGSNSGYETSPSNFSVATITASLVHTEYHFIMNDTTFVMNAIEAPTSSPTQNLLGGTIFSDFEKTPYDEYAIALNPLYYPGGAVGHFTHSPNSVAAQSSSNNNMNAYRFQFQDAASGTFKNSALSTTTASGYNLAGYGKNQTGLTYFSTLPAPNRPTMKTFGPSGQSIMQAPLLLDGQGHAIMGDTYTTATECGQDARFHNLMLNSYRITSATGITGDYYQTDNTSYYIFGGHRHVSYASGGNLYNYYSNTGYGAVWMANYSFPKDNVTMP
jgi:hypothetical protein